MFDVGFWELLLLSLLGLLILGPERLPRVATQIGRWAGRARRAASQLRYQIEREVELEERQAERKQRPGEPPPGSRPNDSQP
jgi:sec-independent protein translocase protein TatB